jgi:hypothetical protein
LEGEPFTPHLHLIYTSFTPRGAPRGPPPPPSASPCPTSHRPKAPPSTPPQSGLRDPEINPQTRNPRGFIQRLRIRDGLGECAPAGRTQTAQARSPHLAGLRPALWVGRRAAAAARRASSCCGLRLTFYASCALHVHLIRTWRRRAGGGWRRRRGGRRARRGRRGLAAGRGLGPTWGR